MRKVLLAAAGAAAMAVAACGFAQAQSGGPDTAARHGIFQADANSDGVVTRAEFDASRASNFARLDANNDGQLTREEMRADRGERGHHRGRGHRGGPGGHGGFEGADANNDGNITRDEFLARPIAMFERLDANHNGVIEASERPQRPERGAQNGDRRERPDRPNPDTDGNGTFSRAEFSAMGAHMFERLDANNDGRVTQEEAQAARGGHRRGQR